MDEFTLGRFSLNAPKITFEVANQYNTIFKCSFEKVCALSNNVYSIGYAMLCIQTAPHYRSYII